MYKRRRTSSSGRSSSSYGSSFSKVSSAIKQGVRIGAQLYGAYRRNSYSGQQGRSGVVTTTQKDVKLQYSRKRMPKYKRKAWGKFVKKVRAAQMKNVGTTTIIRNSSVSSTASFGNQNWVAVHLYGSTGTDSTNEAGCRDLADINAQDTRITTASRVLFGSGVMDCTIRNNGDVDLEVDLYDLVYSAETNYPSFNALVTGAQTETTVVPGSVVGITLSQRGATLFDLPYLIKQGKIKILKKTKLYLPAGDSSNYQVRISKNYSIPYNEMDDGVATYNNPYKTRTLVAIHKPVIGQDVSSLILGCTRKYMYKIMDDNIDHDANI